MSVLTLASLRQAARLRRMSWKVLITARPMKVVGQHGLDQLRQAGCELVFPPHVGPFSEDELRQLLVEIDAVLASVEPYSAAVLESTEATTLKLISRWGVGYDAIDIPAATRLGIPVAYTPGMLDDTVADYTFALLLALARGVHEGHMSMRKGEWMPTWGHTISGKTLGIVGCGRIGLAVARRAAAFNLRRLAFDPAPSPQATALGVQFVSLEELLSASDFVTLHAALTPETSGLIGAAQLRKMKPSAQLINAGRGALLDESALVEALEQGWIAGAALDTFAHEPLPPDHPLRRAPRVLLAPHQASWARETGEQISLAAAQAIVDLRQGRPPRSVVNPAVLQSSRLRAKLQPPL